MQPVEYLLTLSLPRPKIYGSQLWVAIYDPRVKWREIKKKPNKFQKAYGNKKFVRLSLGPRLWPQNFLSQAIRWCF